jgi:hypothetical protein
MIGQIAGIADTHILSPHMESGSLFPHQLARMQPTQAETFYQHVREINERAFQSVQSEMRQHAPFDLLVHFGDMTGGWRERGLNHPSVTKIARDMMRELRTLSSNMRVCAGNHETGYSHPGSLPGSGISEEAILVCEDVFGELWWYGKINGLVHLGVCSSLASYTGNIPQLTKRARQQQTFVSDILTSNRHYGFVLYAHDPGTPKLLARQLREHTHRLRKFVFGDKHAPWAESMLTMPARWAGLKFLPSRTRIGTHQRFLAKGALCPSTAPLWCKGHGYIILQQQENSAISVVRHRTPLTPGTNELPLTSVIRGALWMIPGFKRS